MRKRRPHVIKRVNGSRLPSLCVAVSFIDDEGRASKKGAIVIGRFVGGKLKSQQVEVGWAKTHWQRIFQLCRYGQSVWLVCKDLHDTLTRTGFFDLLTAKEWAIKREGKDQTGVAVHEPKCCFYVATRRDGGKLTCVDSKNYEMGTFDHWGPHHAVNAALVMEWWAKWLGWINEHQAGSLRLTIASQAHYCYRRNFMDGEIFVHDHLPALALEEDAFHGGRCEAFRIGELAGKIYHLDAQSLYGACAAVAMMPVRLLAFSTEDKPCAVGPARGMICEVTVDLPEPIVPWRDRESGITIWPVGKFRTSLCQPELEEVKPYIRKIHRAAVYGMEPCFFAWARWNWKRREEARLAGDRQLEKMLKHWSQFCYGKWAARWRGWRADPGTPATGDWELWYEKDEETKKIIPHRSIGGRVEEFVDGGLSPSACPAISAWINSMARVFLLHCLRTAGKGHVFYCDTDSLFVDADGYARLLTAGIVKEHTLGALRVIGRHERVVIHGWKYYECDGVMTCSGIPAKKRERIIDEVEGERGEPLTVAAGVGRPPQITGTPVKWTRSADYRHGHVDRDGTVRPFHMGG